MSRSSSEHPDSSGRDEAGATAVQGPPPGPARPEEGLSRRGFLQTGTHAAGAAALLGLPTVAPVASAATAPPAGPPAAVLGPGAMPVTLLVNGKEVKVTIEPNETLASVLRERLGLTGTKIGCDRGACGACTVWLDGAPTGACLTMAMDVAGTGGPTGWKPRAVTTIEGLQKGPALHPLQQAFLAADALQCGFCTPGMVMSCAALIEQKKKQGPAALSALGEPEVREAIAGNLCRCGSYPHVISATLQLAHGQTGAAPAKPAKPAGPAPAGGAGGGR